jgi:hypothetical protein
VHAVLAAACCFVAAPPWRAASLERWQVVPAPVHGTRSALPHIQAEAARGAPTVEELDVALLRARHTAEEASGARRSAEKLAEMPFFKKTEQDAREKWYEQATEAADEATRLEAIASEAHTEAEAMQAAFDEVAAEDAAREAQAFDAMRREELGDEYDEVYASEEPSLNGSDDRGFDIQAILGITAPTVLFVLALPALNDMMTS